MEMFIVGLALKCAHNQIQKKKKIFSYESALFLMNFTDLILYYVETKY